MPYLIWIFFILWLTLPTGVSAHLPNHSTNYPISERLTERSEWLSKCQYPLPSWICKRYAKNGQHPEIAWYLTYQNIKPPLKVKRQNIIESYFLQNDGAVSTTAVKRQLLALLTQQIPQPGFALLAKTYWGISLKPNLLLESEIMNLNSLGHIFAVSGWHLHWIQAGLNFLLFPLFYLMQVLAPWVIKKRPYRLLAPAQQIISLFICLLLTYYWYGLNASVCRTFISFSLSVYCRQRGILLNPLYVMLLFTSLLAGNFWAKENQYLDLGLLFSSIGYFLWSQNSHLSPQKIRYWLAYHLFQQIIISWFVWVFVGNINWLSVILSALISGFTPLIMLPSLFFVGLNSVLCAFNFSLPYNLHLQVLHTLITWQASGIKYLIQIFMSVSWQKWNLISSSIQILAGTVYSLVALVLIWFVKTTYDKRVNVIDRGTSS